MDPASAVVLALTARRLHGSHIALLASTRTDAAGPFLHAGLDGHEVRPLNDDASFQLLGARFPGIAAAVHQRILDEAQGNRSP